MRWSLCLTIIFSLFLPLLAWDQQDYEIFDLVSALEAAEGKGTTFYSFLNVTKGATVKEITTSYKKRSLQLHPDKNPDVPNIHERFARLGVIRDILKDSEKRKRYDYFHDNGVPVWRGTGYYYSRFRPGLITVLIFLALLSNTVHYLILHLNRRSDLARIRRFQQSARMVAWGPRLKEQAGRKVVKIPLGGGPIRGEDSSSDDDDVSRRRGGGGGNFLRMIVEGSSVYILTDEGEEILLDESSAPSPTMGKTWIPNLFRKGFRVVFFGGRKRNHVVGEEVDGDGDGELDGDVTDVTDVGEVDGSAMEKKGKPVMAQKQGGRRRKVVKSRK